jgi:probable F420-dependent oxidoreductase
MIQEQNPALERSLVVGHFSVMKRPFRFNVVVEHAQTSTEWINKARLAEELGYTTFLVPDHTWVEVDPVVGLMAAAASTSRIRIGSHVFCNDFRNPTLLAKQVASIDVFSGGRFQLGLGCGYFSGDYLHTGIPFDSVGMRISRLEEAISLIKSYFSSDVLNFSGQYYQAQGMAAKPKPAQKQLPLYMGGAGKRVLSLAGREADIIGLGAKFVGPAAFAFDLRSTQPAANHEKLEWIRAAAGTRFEQLEFSTTVFKAVITSSDAQRDAVAQRMAETFRVAPEEVLHSMNVLVGTAEQIIDELEEQRAVFGISCIEILEGDMETFAPLVAKLTGK